MLDNSGLEELFSGARLMAILRGIGVQRSLAVAQTAWDLGIDVVEIPIQTDEDLEALRQVAAAGREQGRIVGAGTVITLEHVAQAAAAGAAFTVSPGFDPEVVAASHQAGMPSLPGVATPSEVQQALKAGLTWLKAFPASVLGPAWLNAMRGPFPQARFVTTGGMTATNAGDFLRAGAEMVAVGSALEDPAQLPLLSALLDPASRSVTDIDMRIAHDDAQLASEIDVVAAAHAVDEGWAVLVDTRRRESWDHGHAAGAMHLPKSSLHARIDDLPRDRTLIVYGWGPGCNGATSTARMLLAAGHDVQEMIGGYEYWARNGFATEAGGVISRRDPDPLVTAAGVGR